MKEIKEKKRKFHIPHFRKQRKKIGRAKER